MDLLKSFSGKICDVWIKVILGDSYDLPIVSVRQTLEGTFICMKTCLHMPVIIKLGSKSLPFTNGLQHSVSKSNGHLKSKFLASITN